MSEGGAALPSRLPLAFERREPNAIVRLRLEPAAQHVVASCDRSYAGVRAELLEREAFVTARTKRRVPEADPIGHPHDVRCEVSRAVYVGVQLKVGRDPRDFVRDIFHDQPKRTKRGSV